MCYHHSCVELWESWNDLNGCSLLNAGSVNWNELAAERLVEWLIVVWYCASVFSANYSGSIGTNICSFVISVVLLHVTVLLRTSVNKNLFELIKLLISAQPHLIYHKYIRVLYMPWRCLLVWIFILTYFKTLHWMGADCVLHAWAGLHAVQSPLLPIEQEAGWVAEPVQLLWREEKKKKSVSTHPKMDWFLCCMASRLDAIPITGSQLSMIRNCSCNNSLP